MIFYQLSIITTIIFAVLILEIKGAKTGSVLWLCETIFMVYTPWLIFYQLINIDISFIIGYTVGFVFIIGCTVGFLRWYYSKSKLERDYLKHMKI